MKARRSQARLEACEGKRVLGTPPSSNSTPHRNRYIAALATLSPSRSESDVSVAAFAKDDPRSYLINVMRRSAQQGPTHEGGWTSPLRVKKSMLPFESIGRDVQVHDIIQTLDVNPEAIERLYQNSRLVEAYESGQDLIYHGVHADTAAALEEKLTSLIKRKYRGQDGTAFVIPDIQFHALHSESVTAVMDRIAAST
jgi:hypothetical protein